MRRFLQKIFGLVVHNLRLWLICINNVLKLPYRLLILGKLLLKRLWVPGFAMIETVAALGICSIFSMYLLSMIISMRNMYMDYITDNNAKIVLTALENYVNKNGLLPYPADPSSGREFEYPEDETSWEMRPEKYMRGIVPYNSLGIDIKYAKNGHGSFFTYVVNPTLCGRKNIINVPPDDPRESIDYYSYDPTKPVIFILQIARSLPNYSSFRAVRSYNSKYQTSQANISASIKNSYVKKWDIVDQIQQAAILCMYNGQKIATDQCAHIYPPRPSTKFSPTSAIDEDRYKFLMMTDFSNSNKNDFYKISDTIALVLISHGRYGHGAFSATGTICPVQSKASMEKVQNSNFSTNKSLIFVNKSPGSSGIFDDKVYWVSRFNLVKFKPFMVDIFDMKDYQAKS